MSLVKFSSEKPNNKKPKFAVSVKFAVDVPIDYFDENGKTFHTVEKFADALETDADNDGVELPYFVLEMIEHSFEPDEVRWEVDVHDDKPNLR